MWACADALLAAGEGFAAVIANAGVMAAPQGTTVDGFDTQFRTNHLGHFVLVNRVAHLLRPGGHKSGDMARRGSRQSWSE